MINVSIWTILGVLTVILLVVYWRKRNAVWGGLTAGIIISIIVAIFNLFKGSGFNWSIVGKGAIIGVLIGFATEILGQISGLIRPKDAK
jgi:Na+/proline symporter